MLRSWNLSKRDKINKGSMNYKQYETRVQAKKTYKKESYVVRHVVLIYLFKKPSRDAEVR